MLKTVGNPSTRYGDQTIIDGNLVIGTNGKGIDFSATPGTGTSELLNDYEEGTWTPNQGSGLVVTGTFSSSGTYTKVGRQVTVTGILNGSTSIATTATGTFVPNLPFTVGSSSVGSMAGVWSDSGCFIALAGSVIALSVEALTPAGSIYFSCTYFV